MKIYFYCIKHDLGKNKHKIIVINAHIIPFVFNFGNCLEEQIRVFILLDTHYLQFHQQLKMA